MALAMAFCMDCAKARPILEYSRCLSQHNPDYSSNTGNFSFVVALYWPELSYGCSSLWGCLQEKGVSCRWSKISLVLWLNRNLFDTRVLLMLSNKCGVLVNNMGFKRKLACCIVGQYGVGMMIGKVKLMWIAASGFGDSYVGEVNVCLSTKGMMICCIR